MSSGISAGNFWVPVYLLWAKFEPPLAFWMTLVTMLCGYGSGVVRNLRQGTIDQRVIIRHLPITVPAALIGGYLAPALNVSWLILLFGIFVFSYGVQMLASLVHSAAGKSGILSSLLSPWERDRVREETHDRGIAFMGGFLLGLITVGLGELLLPHLLAKRKALAPAEVVGSTVLVIFVTSLAATLVRLNPTLLTALGEQRATLLAALLFAGPGVILGGQLGPRMAWRLNTRASRWYVGSILLLVGMLMLVRFLALEAFAR
jgi:uncharacterized membrane protein YfcA